MKFSRRVQSPSGVFYCQISGPHSPRNHREKTMTSTLSNGMIRRTLLKTTAAAALFTAIKTTFPSGAFAATAGPEVTGVKIGYIALTDAAALVIAKEKGFFEKHGLPDVEVAKQASWGTTRDNLVLGCRKRDRRRAYPLADAVSDAYAGKVTQNNVPVRRCTILARLNCDGQSNLGRQGICGYLKIGLDAAPLKAAIDEEEGDGGKSKAAMTFPGGTHDLWMRYWLAAGGIDPDKDISTIVVPPPQMVANMKVGNMDAFLRLRAVERAAGQPEHRLYRSLTTGETLEQAPGKGARHARRLGREKPERRQRADDGGDGSAAVGARAWTTSDEVAAIVAKSAMDQLFRCEDIIDRSRATVQLRQWPCRRWYSVAIMKFWDELRLVSLSRAMTSGSSTENIRWGKFDAGYDIQGTDRSR
jgi:nitrate/nitrite transport system substrate-binding protein